MEAEVTVARMGEEKQGRRKLVSWLKWPGCRASMPLPWPLVSREVVKRCGYCGDVVTVGAHDEGFRIEAFEAGARSAGPESASPESARGEVRAPEAGARRAKLLSIRYSKGSRIDHGYREAPKYAGRGLHYVAIDKTEWRANAGAALLLVFLAANLLLPMMLGAEAFSRPWFFIGITCFVFGGVAAVLASRRRFSWDVLDIEAGALTLSYRSTAFIHRVLSIPVDEIEAISLSSAKTCSSVLGLRVWRRDGGSVFFRMVDQPSLEMLVALQEAIEEFLREEGAMA